MNFGRKTLIFFIGILLSLTVFTKENNQFYAKNL